LASLLFNSTKKSKAPKPGRKRNFCGRATHSKFGWQLEAWSVFSNHYHFVGQSPVDEDVAKTFLRCLDSFMKKPRSWFTGWMLVVAAQSGITTGKRSLHMKNRIWRDGAMCIRMRLSTGL